MNARDALLTTLTNPNDTCLCGDPCPTAENRIEAHRTQVLNEAADELEAIDPIEFALGAIDPITELRRMAHGDQKPAPAAYADTRGEPGEGGA